jgi:hypothetical protein
MRTSERTHDNFITKIIKQTLLMGTVHIHCDKQTNGISKINEEDGGDMFLRNVGSYKNYTALSYPKNSTSFIITAVKTSNPDRVQCLQFSYYFVQFLHAADKAN